MITWTCASIARQAGLAACLCLAMACAAFGETKEKGHSTTVFAVEWIPLHANGAVVEALQEASAKKPGTECAIKRGNAFGDDAELNKMIADVNAHPTKAVIGFGDHVAARLAAECPNTHVIAVFARDHAALLSGAKGQVTVIDTEPQAADVVRIARGLKQPLKRIGIMYTDGFGPNGTLAEGLEKAGAKDGFSVARLKVHPGFCRTESDFRRAIAETHAKTPLDILFVPGDPNSARFGTTIRACAGEAGILVIGTEAIAGKGCAVALCPDFPAIAERVGEACRAAPAPTAKPTIVAVAPKVEKAAPE